MNTAHETLGVQSAYAVTPRTTVHNMDLPALLGGGARAVRTVAIETLELGVGDGVARRLGRPQLLALAAAHAAVRAAPPPPPPRRCAVMVATALGNLGETLAFVDNMLRHDERAPLPTRFVNSVHNAVAAQLAMALNCQGENHTFTHAGRSLLQAFAQARRCLNTARADRVLLVAVDALDPHFAAVAEGTPERPLGEGAAAFVLTRAGEVGVQAHLAGALFDEEDTAMRWLQAARAGAGGAEEVAWIGAWPRPGGAGFTAWFDHTDHWGATCPSAALALARAVQGRRDPTVAAEWGSGKAPGRIALLDRGPGTRSAWWVQP